MMFKTWGLTAMYQALAFTAFQKIGHYMKIPHRPMFFCLVIGTIISSTVQLSVQEWMFSHVEDLCGPNQKDSFICPGTNTFGSASIIVGPHSQWSFFLICLCIPNFPVGCHWAKAYLFSWSPLQQAFLLLPCGCYCPTYSVDVSQEVQVDISQVC
jgi:OPT oligopeptide transporter protein